MSDKPNIPIIWGDEIGMSTLSFYSDGVTGYHTRNIDRVANEGVRFTGYGEQSCTDDIVGEPLGLLDQRRAKS